MEPSAILLILLPLFGFQMMLVAKPTTRCRSLTLVVATNAHNMLKDPKPFPNNCLPYKKNISFPDSILPAPAASHSQCPRAMWVIYKFSQEMFHMYNQHGFPVGENGVKWDQEKLDDFFGLLDRVEEDSSCLRLDSESSSLLSSYFSNATSVIEQQDIAVCGWLTVMDDMFRFLKSTLQAHRHCFNQSQAY